VPLDPILATIEAIACSRRCLESDAVVVCVAVESDLTACLANSITEAIVPLVASTHEKETGLQAHPCHFFKDGSRCSEPPACVHIVGHQEGKALASGPRVLGRLMSTGHALEEIAAEAI
tara:strand:+ start:600 stop:956 length:357 start_codon:yes stop_codon:yes gene_type:complete